MRIAFVCSEYPVVCAGGQGRAVRAVVHLLREAGHDVRIVGIYDEALRGTLEPEEGLTVVWQKGWPQAWRLARRELFRVVRGWAVAGEIDLVEAPFSRGWIGRWGKLPVPVVSRVHGSFVIKNRAMGNSVPNAYLRMEARGLQRADAVAAVSHAIASDLRRHFDYDGPISEVPNPVALPEEAWAPVHPPRVVYGGRLSRQKGLDLLLEAWPEIAAAAPDAELHLYGRLEANTEIEELLGRLRNDRVRAHGEVSQERLQRAYLEARVAVFPSRYEAFGLAQAEAMAAACPVVVSCEGAGGELVDDGGSGLICQPLTADSIRDQVCRLLSDKDLATRCGITGRQRIAEWCAPDQVLAQLLAVYHETASGFAAKSDG